MLFHPHGVSVYWPALVIGLGLSLSIKGGGFELSETPSEHLSIHWDGKILGQYQLAYDSSSKERLHDTYKPFLQLLDPDTGQAITKGAGGQFTHHRAIAATIPIITPTPQRIQITNSIPTAVHGATGPVKFHDLKKKKR